MKTTFLFIIFILMTVINSSCYYDKYNEIYPASFSDTCDPSLSVTYTAVVRDIIAQNCLSCHSSNVRNGDVVLETYNDVKSHADDGSLTGSIEGKNGFVRMPPAAALRSCDIEQIKTWINNGTPE